jgi:prepilin-type N-terminal cleavage/methylation domain-containing protein
VRRSDAAFTLLEVMAAVAVVAIVFTTLARVANQGLQSQGTSKRRFEASLLADAVLSQIEVDLAAGTAPAIGLSESEEGFFHVTVDVTPFDLASAVPAFAGPPEEAPGLSLSLPGAGADAGADAESPVRTIEITVAWTEGRNELRVYRTTYGIDLAALPELPAGGGRARAIYDGSRQPR